MNIRRFNYGSAGQLYWKGNEFRDWIGFYDVFTLHWGQDQGGPLPSLDLVRKIKLADQNIKALLYRNLKAIYNTAAELSLFRTNGWILKNAAGEEIVDAVWSDSPMVDTGNPDYQLWVANWIKNTIIQGGFDGTFLDCAIFGTKEHLWGCVGKTSRCNAQTTCPPINPRTGKAYTDADWLNDELLLNRTIKNVLGSIPVLANGTWNGTHFFRIGSHNSYVALIQDPAIDGWMIEGFLLAGNGLWYSETDWKNSVDYIVWIEQNVPINKSVIVPTHMKPKLPTGITHDEIVLYTYASMLLGAGADRIYYMVNEPWQTLQYHGSPFVQTLMRLDLGMPLTTNYDVTEQTNARVYSRQFTKGMVLANPTLANLTVTLPAQYYTLLGELVSSIEVPSRRGIILLEGPPNPPPQYTLSVSTTIGGTTAPPIGNYTYPVNTPITLIATPDMGYYFHKWVINGQVFTTPEVTIQITEDTRAQAYFDVVPPPNNVALLILLALLLVATA